MIDETTYAFKFNSKTKKITNLKKKYKYGDYVMVDGLGNSLTVMDFLSGMPTNHTMRV